MWIELLPRWPEGAAPNAPEVVKVIRFDTPLTAADGMLLLIGAQMHFAEEAAAVGARPGQLTQRDVEDMGYLISVSDECHSAMFRIRREQYDAYLRPAPHIGDVP